MKQLTIFETSIIGLFAGILISTYLLFLGTNDAFIGNILQYTSLKPLFSLIQIPENYSFIGQFIFYTLVYIIYGILVGLILKYINKSKIVSLTIVLFIVAGAFEQIYVPSKIPLPEINNEYQLAKISRPLKNENQQYFGIEAKGDLNQDSKDDIAFLIHRDDADRGTLYYLTTALQTDNGKSGTNLIFLGDKIKPNAISIKDSLIVVNYTKNSTTSDFFAIVESGQLKEYTATSTIE